jgi:predicted transcriptional regulator
MAERKEPARMELRLDRQTERRLVGLARKLELPRTHVIRQAIRQMAERESVERALAEAADDGD